MIFVLYGRCWWIVLMIWFLVRVLIRFFWVLCMWCCLFWIVLRRVFFFSLSCVYLGVLIVVFGFLLVFLSFFFFEGFWFSFSLLEFMELFLFLFLLLLLLLLFFIIVFFFICFLLGIKKFKRGCGCLGC